MTVAFPALKPTDRQFAAPRWPLTSARSQAGAVSRRKWGSQSTDPSLSLTFACTDDQAGAILAAHEEAQGQVVALELPDEVWHGINGTLRAFLDAMSDRLVWTFKEGSVPTMRSLVCGRSEVTVELTAELRA